MCILSDGFKICTVCSMCTIVNHCLGNNFDGVDVMQLGRFVIRHCVRPCFIHSTMSGLTFTVYTVGALQWSTVGNESRRILGQLGALCHTS